MCAAQSQAGLGAGEAMTEPALAQTKLRIATEIACWLRLTYCSGYVIIDCGVYGYSKVF